MQTVMIVEDDPDIRDGVRIAPDCNRVRVDEQEAALTETEYKILKLLMQSPQRIFPVQVIYETVWGEPYFYVSNGTVMVHIRNLRMKVEHNPQNPQRICTVWGKGYHFAAQDISVRFVKENGKAGLAFENAVLPGRHRTDSTKVGLTGIETMMEKMHAECRIEQSGDCEQLRFRPGGRTDLPLGVPASRVQKACFPPVAVQHGGKRHPGGLRPPQTVN